MTRSLNPAVLVNCSLSVTSTLPLQSARSPGSRKTAGGAIDPVPPQKEGSQGRVRAIMRVQTPGLDIKASTNRAAADKASSAEAKAAVDRWNAQLAAGRDILWSPTIRAVLLAGTSCRCVLPRRCSGRGDQYSAIRVSQNALPVLVSRRSRARDARTTGRKR